jgi:hypothetical protein
MLMFRSDTIFVQARGLNYISCCMIFNVNQVRMSVYHIVSRNRVRRTEAVDLRDFTNGGWIRIHRCVVQKGGDCYSAGIRT